MSGTGYSRRSMSARKILLAYDGVKVAEVEETPVAEIGAVLERAQAAARMMGNLTRDERAQILFAGSRGLLANQEDFARTIALESGKPLREARTEVERAAGTLWASGEEAHRLAGEEIPLDAAPNGKGRLGYTMRQPVGVVAAITPFNFPLNLSMHKVGPAIAAGNAVVHKPASATPLSALKAAALLNDCGLPKDALQVVVGPGGELGRALVEAPAARLVSFTGSAAVGRQLAGLAGLKKVTLELGNNSAVVVLEDADLAMAAEACAAGAYVNSGQTCISVQRVLVASAVLPEFLERFTERARALRLGHPLEPETEISSLIEETEAQRVQGWIGEAVRQGARLVSGGGRSRATLQPTVLEGVRSESAVWRDEVFGPVACVNGFASLDQAIAMVNDSRYGLQAGVFTNRLDAALRCLREIEAGSVLINDSSNYRVDLMPYGGRKESGLGKEGPRYAVAEMSETKMISLRV